MGRDGPAAPTIGTTKPAATMYTQTIIVLSMSVVVTLGFPQYVEPPEIEGHLDDAYQFAYAVASPEHGDYHGHQQSRDENGFTSGSYYLLGADGQWSQTNFADKGAGYQALYNQRPAGAPPPQVSEVSYQIFFHPSATAISAQGGVPAPPEAPQPLTRFNRDILYSEPANPTVLDTNNLQRSARFQAYSDLETSPSTNSNSIVVPVRTSTAQRTARVQPIQDLETSPSTNSNAVVVQAPPRVVIQPSDRNARAQAINVVQPSPRTARAEAIPVM